MNNSCSRPRLESDRQMIRNYISSGCMQAQLECTVKIEGSYQIVNKISCFLS